MCFANKSLNSFIVFHMRRSKAMINAHLNLKIIVIDQKIELSLVMVGVNKIRRYMGGGGGSIVPFCLFVWFLNVLINN